MTIPASSHRAAPGGTQAGVPLGAVADAAGRWAALHAAQRLGVLERLAATPEPPEALAEAAGLDPRLTAVVLELLAALGIAEVDGEGAYRVAPSTAAAVDWAGRVYGLLPDAWRQVGIGPRYDEPSDAAAHYPAVVGLLADRTARVADELAARLARPRERVLDVGAGAAPWSLAVARREPTCRVTAIDLPDVIEVTGEAVAAAGCAERYELVAADVFAHLPEGPYDLVLVGALCHLFDGPTAARLVERLAGVLAPGGRLAVIDAVADDPHTPAGDRAVYELGLALRTGGGRLHPTSACRRWMADAGLRWAGGHPARTGEALRLHLLLGIAPP